ncbi:hypothetical protein HII12_000397 [Brettanomyces bruxellensis]|uniref:BRO1 domain-containing protein n=1 Tax=Dekkera bruxellensis TaxID=5007 RepID=A0A8H6EZ72_DEKBR|nr:hypothetical protein HII12_000397 [Brettanomyces bruxellensis]
MVGENLLKVPFKRTDKVDLCKELTSVIQNEFYQPPSNFTDDLQIINELRRYTEEEQTNLKTITALKSYYIQISALSQKLPKTVCNLHGGMYSQLALVQNRMTSDGLKKAGIYFQYAAGCFQVLTEDQFAPSLDALPGDLRTDTLSALTYLMLASAQEIYWLKAVTDALKDTVVAKLSMQTSSFYESTALVMRKAGVFPSEWISFCRVKSLHFKAATLNRLATHLTSKEQYGEALSRLRSSSRIAGEALKIKITNEQVLKDLTDLNKVVQEELSKAERENDLIYLQDVPNEKSLPEPAKANLVKPLVSSGIIHPVKALSESAEYGKPLFKSLIPYFVVEMAAGFKEKCITYINSNVKGPLSVATKQLDDIMESLNIEYSIEVIMKPQRVPETIMKYRENITDMGGASRLDEMLSQLNSLKLRCHTELDSNWRKFNEANEEDNSLRVMYGEKRWTLQPLKEEANDILSGFKQFEQYLRESTKGDETIEQQVEELRPFLGVYTDEDALRQFIPAEKVLDLNPQFCELVMKMKNILKEIDTLKTERFKLLENVETKLDHKYNEVQKQGEGDVNAEQLSPVVEMEITKFKDDLLAVRNSIQRQHQLLNELQKRNIEYMEQKRRLRVSPEREQALDVLSKTYHGFCEVIGNIKQGYEFYNDFSTRLGLKHEELEQHLEERYTAMKQLQRALDEQDRQFGGM